MPGFPFGPIRPNTRAGLPLTVRVLVPAVRRSLAVRSSGAAAARVIGKKGIVPAIMATPDARICRRVRSLDFSFPLNGISLASPCHPLLRSIAAPRKAQLGRGFRKNPQARRAPGEVTEGTGLEYAVVLSRHTPPSAAAPRAARAAGASLAECAGHLRVPHRLHASCS